MADTKMPNGTMPKAASISKNQIISAYVYDSTRAQRRIESYGRLNRKILRNIGKPAQKDGTVGK
jgi:hypothetical protein